MNLELLTSSDEPKPWLDIYCNSVTQTGGSDFGGIPSPEITGRDSQTLLLTIPEVPRIKSGTLKAGTVFQGEIAGIVRSVSVPSIIDIRIFIGVDPISQSTFSVASGSPYEFNLFKYSLTFRAGEGELICRCIMERHLTSNGVTSITTNNSDVPIDPVYDLDQLSITASFSVANADTSAKMDSGYLTRVAG